MRAISPTRRGLARFVLSGKVRGRHLTDSPQEDRMHPSRDIARLLAIMAALRTPGSGCPWDLEQDFATIAPYTIEEAYEVAEAIARGDLLDLKDELGDLLLQVVFHARMAEEAGAFDFGDVVASAGNPRSPPQPASSPAFRPACPPSPAPKSSPARPRPSASTGRTPRRSSARSRRKCARSARRSRPARAARSRTRSAISSSPPSISPAMPASIQNRRFAARTPSSSVAFTPSSRPSRPPAERPPTPPLTTWRNSG